MDKERERLSHHRYVVVLGGNQSFYRELTRNIPLRSIESTKGEVDIVYDLDSFLLRKYINEFITDVFGIPFQICRNMSYEEKKSLFRSNCGFDSIANEDSCRWAIRPHISLYVHRMLSADTLCFGVGTLRHVFQPENTFKAALYRQDASYRTYIPSSKIRPKHTVKHGLIVARTQWNHSTQTWSPEAYESTNLLYADVFGEIEQLSSRRNQIPFMKKVAEALQGLNDFPQTGRTLGGWTIHPKYLPLYREHLRAQSVWDKAPGSPEELIERIKFILDQTLIDG